MPKFDYVSARKSGYTDQEITSYIQQEVAKGNDLYIDKDEYNAVNQQSKKQGGFQEKVINPLAKVGEGFGEFGIGVFKGVGSTLAGASALGEKVLSFGKAKDTLGEEVQQKLKPTNTAQKVGFGVEQAAEFLAPSAGVLKGQKLIKGAVESANLASKYGKAGAVANVAGKAAAFAVPEAISTGAVSATQGASKEEIDRNLLLSLGIPLAGKAIAGTAQLTKQQAPRIVNSLIKPLLKDFSYGKNPGRAVAEEGIVANSLDELAEKISTAKEKTGREIGVLLRRPSIQSKAIDISSEIGYIDETLEELKKAPRTNKEAINRLDDAKKDILGIVEDDIGNETQTRVISNLSPLQAFEFKEDIAAITKFTGNASDDKVVNKTLKRMYGGIKEKINNAIPGLAQKNERYADLVSAEIATKYRDKIAERQNVLGFNTRNVAGVSAILGGIFTGSVDSALLAGVSAGLLNSAIGSPAVKTRIAAWLAKTSPAEQQALFSKVPLLKEVVERVFGGKK